MVDPAKRVKRVDATPDAALLNRLKSGDQSALQTALSNPTPGGLAALEETIARYGGNPNITFCRLGGQRVYTQESTLAAKEALMELASRDALLSDPAHTQSLIASLGASPELSNLIMRQLSAQPQKLYDYQLLGVQMQLSHLLSKPGAAKPGIRESNPETHPKQKIDPETLQRRRRRAEALQTALEKAFFGYTDEEIEASRRRRLEREKERERSEEIGRRIDTLVRQTLENAPPANARTAQAPSPRTLRKPKKQVMLLNKLLSNDLRDIREALTSLCGFANAKREWAVLTVNKAIIMLEYIAKQYDTPRAIENKETNNFFVSKAANSRNILFSDSTLGNKYEHPVENDLYTAALWLEHLKKLTEYPYVMLADFALTQEVILACSGEAAQVKQILQDSKDRKLAKRLYALFRGQMEVQEKFTSSPHTIQVCKRCGCRKFYHYKHSLVCEV